jgi:acetyl-CoA acetyltransferase
VFDFGVLGTTVPQKSAFHGLPWFMGMIGAAKVGGPTINQACATGVRCLLAAAQEIEADLASTALVAACDRISNGPHLVYPNPSAPGGTASHENWVLDNFANDPLGGHAMINTAENVARKYQVSTAEQHDVVLRRVEQYAAALADERAFQKRYMTLPFDVPRADFKKSAGTVCGRRGGGDVDRRGPRPAQAGAAGRHRDLWRADSSGRWQCRGDRDDAGEVPELSKDASIRVSLMGFGLARADLAHMPEATIPAAKQALDQAGLKIGDITAVKSHNPFAVNDIVFARQTGADLKTMNNYGCSLIWGHPQGPTGLRSVIELIEELVIRGGGRGLFQGCAAGDTAMAVVIDVDQRKQ